MSLAGIRVGNRVKFQRGAIVRARQEGIGLSRSWFARTERNGIEIRYETGALSLLRDRSGRIVGVEARSPSGIEELSARAVILACGGFEANAQWRAQYLGAPWDHAKVRGTAHNQGDGLRMAFAAGALPRGQWSGRHSTPISNEWPDFADRKRTDKSNRLSYPFGVMLNRAGRRFVDEGEDLGFYTYAKYGGEILRQPGSLAWQIFDQKTMHLLEPRYRTSDPITSDTLEGLVEQLDIDDRAQALRTLDAYNEAACDTAGFDPTVLDGLAATGIEPPKSNWALRLDEPPFAAYSATGWHHLHLRRARDRRAGEGCSVRTGARCPGSTPAARWSEGSSTSTTPAGPALSPARCSAASRGGRRRGTERAPDAREGVRCVQIPQERFVRRTSRIEINPNVVPRYVD